MSNTSGVFILEEFIMAKETVKVDNDLADIKLEKSDKIVKTKEKKEKQKTVNEKKTGKEKEGYFKKLRAEIKLVTWPTRKNVFKYSFAAIMMIMLLAVFFIGVSALFDLLYSFVQGWIG